MALTLAIGQFPYPEVALKVSLSAGIGLLVGLEHEWSHKGSSGFLAISILGGLVSGASTTATAATLAAAGKISPQTAGVAAILTSMSSALVNLPLVYQQTHQRLLMRKITMATLAIVGIGIVVLVTSSWLRAGGAAGLPQMLEIHERKVTLQDDA